MNKRLVEIRAYKLKPGMRERFHRTVVERSLPLLVRWGTDVVAFGPSPHDEDGYFLVRAYADAPALRAQQDAFYASDDWRLGPRQDIVDAIEASLDTRLWLSPAAIDELRVPECRVVELRQYTLHPGRRGELVALFEREFVDAQRAAGLHVLGSFEDEADADRFVWLRGFADMAARRRGLEAFYGGPAWARHRDAANATMRDSDDVLLLRPLTALPAPQAAGRWHLLVAPLAVAPDAALAEALRTLAGEGHCWLASEPAENDYPRLPVRRDTVVVGIAPSAMDVPAALQDHLAGPVQRLVLRPTPRSPLR